MEYTANISEAASRQKHWDVITSDLLLSDNTSESSDDGQFTSASTGRQGRKEAQVHNEDPEASILPPHDVNGDKANADGSLATAAPQPAAPVQQAQLALPAAPQVVGLEAPFHAGVSYI